MAKIVNRIKILLKKYMKFHTPMENMYMTLQPKTTILQQELEI